MIPSLDTPMLPPSALALIAAAPPDASLASGEGYDARALTAGGFDDLLQQQLALSEQRAADPMPLPEATSAMASGQTLSPQSAITSAAPLLALSVWAFSPVPPPPPQAEGPSPVAGADAPTTASTDILSQSPTRPTPMPLALPLPEPALLSPVAPPTPGIASALLDASTPPAPTLQRPNPAEGLSPESISTQAEAPVTPEAASSQAHIPLRQTDTSDAPGETSETGETALEPATDTRSRSAHASHHEDTAPHRLPSAPDTSVSAPGNASDTAPVTPVTPATASAPSAMAEIALPTTPLPSLSPPMLAAMVTVPGPVPPSALPPDTGSASQTHGIVARLATPAALSSASSGFSERPGLNAPVLTTLPLTAARAHHNAPAIPLPVAPAAGVSMPDKAPGPPPAHPIADLAMMLTTPEAIPAQERALLAAESALPVNRPAPSGSGEWAPPVVASGVTLPPVAAPLHVAKNTPIEGITLPPQARVLAAMPAMPAPVTPSPGPGDKGQAPALAMASSPEALALPGDSSASPGGESALTRPFTDSPSQEMSLPAGNEPPHREVPSALPLTVSPEAPVLLTNGAPESSAMPLAASVSATESPGIASGAISSHSLSHSTLGPTNSPGSNRMETPGPALQTVAPLAEAVASGRSQVVLQLRPESLGEVRAHLSLSTAHGVSARLVTATEQARDALLQDVDTLRRSLEQQGVRVERLQIVSMSDTASAPSESRSLRGDIALSGAHTASISAPGGASHAGTSSQGRDDLPSGFWQQQQQQHAPQHGYSRQQGRPPEEGSVFHPASPRLDEPEPAPLGGLARQADPLAAMRPQGRVSVLI